MALALMGFILISQFNSVVKPVIILSSVIMSTVGVLIGLMVFKMPFVIIMTGLGIISLAGIVVNNAIVLIDYIDILRDRDGMNRREALVQGGKTRFRPVILTATTTALGLVPLAIGLNFDFFGLYGSLTPDLYWGGDQAAWWGPMAVAVIVGIMFATFLTLVLVPVMYSLVDDFAAFFKRHYVAPEEAEETAGSGSHYEGAVSSEVPGYAETPEPEPAPVLRAGKNPLQAPLLRPQTGIRSIKFRHLPSPLAGSRRRRRSSMKKTLVLAALVAASSLLAHPLSGQQEGEDVRAGALNVYLECAARGCESSHYRTEITFVNWVRDQGDAQLHIIMTSTGTGSGDEFLLDFIGRGELEGQDDQLTYSHSDTDSDDQRSQGITGILAVGLARYAVLARPGRPLHGEHAGSRRSGALELPPGLQGEVNDPWDYWVFRLGGDVNFEDEDLKDEQRYSANFSANRTTEMWKVSLTGRGSYTKVNGQYSSGDDVRGHPEGRVHRWPAVLLLGGAMVLGRRGRDGHLDPEQPGSVGRRRDGCGVFLLPLSGLDPAPHDAPGSGLRPVLRLRGGDPVQQDVGDHHGGFPPVGHRLPSALGHGQPQRLGRSVSPRSRDLPSPLLRGPDEHPDRPGAGVERGWEHLQDP